MALCVVLAVVSSTFIPEETELTLSFLVSGPIELHFNCSHALNNNGVVGKTFGGGVIYLDWGSWLRPSHLV
jgi:hypothetical protein